MTSKIPQKIIILGDAGRGKSTLASKLSGKLGIPHHATDDYFYEVKFSKPRDRQKSIDEISKLFHEPKWIVEGTTHHLIERGLDSADLIIYLRYRSIFPQWFRIIKRHFARKDGNLMKILPLAKHVFYKRYGLGYKKGKPTSAELIAPYKNKVVKLSSFREINIFVSNF